jgi:hypothetical protein
MGHTYKRHRSDIEEEFAGKRQGRISRHSNNRKTHGMPIKEEWEISDIEDDYLPIVKIQNLS